MSRFLQRHKKKGLLAALLMFFKRGKGVGPIILMIALLAFVFVIPTSSFRNHPFVVRVAKALGLRSSLGGGDMSVEGGSLSEALRARDQERLALRGSIAAQRGLMANYGKSSVGLVKGDRVEDMGEKRMYDDVAGGKGKSVDGVLRPEDADKMGDGVPLSAEELMGGLMNKAYAEGLAGGDGIQDFGGSSGAGFNMGISGRPGSASGARAAGGVDLVDNALDGTDVPATGRTSIRGVGKGRLGMRRVRKLNARHVRSISGKSYSDRKSPMYQLAEGRAYSVAAAPPPGKCDPNGGCPNEYASNTSGMTFDGGKHYDGTILAEELGDPPTPDMPDQGEIDSLIDEAEQMEEDSVKCEKANDQYGPQMDRKMAEIQALSDKLNAMDCGGGGCSKSKARKCQAVGDQMKVKCREYNQIAQQWANACPLTEGRYSKMNCNQ